MAAGGRKKIFDYEEYRSFLKDSLAGQKGAGTALARFIQASPSLVISVVKGDRDFTSEQAIAFGEFLQLNDLEIEFLLALVELARAGNERTKRYLARRITALRRDAWRDAVMGADTKTLTVDEKYVFYSDWSYSAIRMLTTIPRFRKASAIAEHLGLPEVNVNAALEFLVKIGFCVKEGERYIATGTSPEMKREDPAAKRHLQNCRQVAAARLHKQGKPADNELIFSVVAAYSKENAQKIREKIYRRIQDILVDSKQGKAEVVYYLNVDFIPI